MKIPLKRSILGAVMMFATVAVASATTYQLGSYGTNSSNFGNSNSAMVFDVAGSMNPGPGFSPTSATVNIPATAPWSSALTATSSWVSFADTSPGVVPFANNGTYFFSTQFTLDANATSVTISLLADDTVTVFLDGVPSRLVRSRSVGANVTCQVQQPNCTDPLTLTITDPNILDNLMAGTHTLNFEVFQTNSQALGVDFTATIETGSPVPEPSSLLLLGTGLIGTAGTLLRRMRA